MNSAEIKMIAFDYDGVIVDSFEHNLETVNEALQEIGHHTLSTADDLRNLQKMTFAQLGLDLGVPAEMVPDWELHTAKKLLNTTHKVELFDTIAAAISALSENYVIAVMSNTLSSVIETVLQREGLRDKFAVIYGGEHPGNKADKLKKLAAENNIAPAQVCMIGDALSDVRAAHEAGTRSIAVTWGFQNRELLETVEPDLLVDSPEELLSVFSEK